MDTEKPAKFGLGAAEDAQEYFSDAQTVKQNVAALAVALKEKKKAVVFTGAGISTASKLPDYRGPQGVWTLREQGKEAVFDVTFDQAQPTLAHRVVAALEKGGFVGGVVSTNVDNLHRKSGCAAVAELHGNVFVERCEVCKIEYRRAFDVTAPRGCQPDHKTGHECEGCGGALLDTIVHFGESLSNSDFERATQMSSGAAVALVLGTSLRVKPASQLPASAEKRFIVNLQKTPHDMDAVVTRCRIDLFMHLLAREMGLEVASLPAEVETGWEADQDERSKDNERKEREASRKSLAALVTPQLKQFRPQQKNEIANERNVQNRDISPAVAMPMMVRNCSDCSFRVTSNTVVKLVLLECENVSLIVGGRILTGVLEIINCKNVSVAIVRALPTIQIDNSQGTVLGFVAPALSGSIVASANSSLSVAPRKDLQPERVVFGATPEGEYWQGMTQFLTRVQEDCTLLTELVVREGAGYATTQREKDAADERDAKTEAAMLKYLGTMIK
jgi:mono-ADP-ribosyltransferase sirtuin 6